VPYGSHGDYTDSEAICMDMSDEYDRNPISAGPYKVKEWKPNESVLLERFDQWFGWNQTIKGSYGNEYAFPKMDQAFKFVKFIVLPDGADLKEEILKRDVDIILSHNYKEIDETTKETYSEIDKIRDFSIKWPRIGGRAGLMMNIQGDWPTVFGGPGNYPITQTWFRQAISNAINREKLVLDVYQGYAYVRDTIFPASILEYFPDIDTSDYYDFNQGLEEARSILDSNGYPPLGSPAEPDNRFGYGPYLNETPEEATHGHRFRMISPDCPSCNPRSQSIIDDLKSVGIYVIRDVLPWFEYREELKGEIPLTDYNSTCREKGIPDPDFHGPTYDFFVSGRGNFFGLPHDYVIGWSNRLWYEEGCIDNSWFNYDYEVALAKIWGGFEFMPYVETPSDAPFPTPRFSCNDTRYNEACEEAGYILSRELPFIPLVHYSQLIAINDNIQNFLLDESSIGSQSAAGMIHVAYTFWKSGENQAYLDYLFILGISSSVLIGIGLSIVTYVKKKK
jgi:ABC-type transport system substrate-binding protein